MLDESSGMVLQTSIWAVPPNVVPLNGGNSGERGVRRSTRSSYIHLSVFVISSNTNYTQLCSTNFAFITFRIRTTNTFTNMYFQLLLIYLNHVLTNLSHEQWLMKYFLNSLVSSTKRLTSYLTAQTLASLNDEAENNSVWPRSLLELANAPSELARNSSQQ